MSMEEIRMFSDSADDPVLNQKNPSFWEQRTLLEKILIAVCALAGAAVIALTFYSLLLLDDIHSDDFEEVVRPKRSINQNGAPNAIRQQNKTPNISTELNDICMTKGCIRTASEIFNSIDETVDPCDNFYDFACGSFVKNTFIPDDKVTVDQFSIVRDKLEEQIRYIINDEIKPSEIKPFVLVKKLNKACMNTALIESRGTAPLLELLSQFGGWPVISGDKWDETNWNWLDVLKKFRRTGLNTNIIFSFTITENLENSSIRSIDIDQTKTHLSRQYLINGLDDELVTAYYDFMVDVAVILGAERKQAKIELLDALNFEIALANISVPSEQRRDLTNDFNPHTIKRLQEKFPYLPWLDYLSAMLPDSVAIDENEIVIVNVLPFFKRLGDLLSGVSNRALSNYLLWRAILTTSSDLPEQIRRREVQYESKVSGQQDQEPRWKECVVKTSESLSAAVGALYVRKYFKGDAKRIALEIVSNVRRAFIEILSKIPWMDNLTRQSALEKAEALTNHIGYPDELEDDKKLEEFYKDLELDSDNLFLNSLKVNKFELDSYFGKLHQPVNKTDWTVHAKAAVVNAYYAPLENSIQYPAGILQDRFFSPNRPHYMNYGAIGQFIGHEITHGFDDQGRLFDLKGNLAEWWYDDTKKKFLEKAKCIIDQYSSFREPMTNLTLNGVVSQGENIADNGALKQAYNAYKTWVAEHGPEKKLPGLNYTPQQLFWISAAQVWCVVSRTEYMKLKIDVGTHILNQYRVLGPIANMKDFSKDFNCPLGANMNPVKKCEVW